MKAYSLEKRLSDGCRIPKVYIDLDDGTELELSLRDGESADALLSALDATMEVMVEWGGCSEGTPGFDHACGYHN